MYVNLGFHCGRKPKQKQKTKKEKEKKKKNEKRAQESKGSACSFADIVS